ncbi:hypothetical protein Ancab_000820 [Ancistrocladus abbreviatus]
MEESANIANNVARAITAVIDWSSPPDARKAAVSFLESVKSGDVRTLASTSFILVKKEWSSEIRLHAFKLLQHLVRLRWEELGLVEQRNFANLAVDLMSEVADPCEEWALKIRREGLSLWQELFPSLVSLSNNGPIKAELVSMMLRWLPEDITVHNEDLEGDRRRILLRGLTQSLPEILPLLYTLLERHFGAALNEAVRQQLDIAKQHAATVTSTLNAITAYAEWAPLPDLAKYGIIHGCGFLLSSPDFRLHACEFFKLVSPRKRPADESASEFDSAMGNIFQIMMNVSRDFLYKSSSSAVDDGEVEFAEYICESMVSLGSTNLQCISVDGNILSVYLHQMLGYFQHFRLALHFQALLFWLALMRDLLSKPRVAVHATGDVSVNSLNSTSGQADNEKKKILSFVSDDMCSAILDICFQRLLRKEKLSAETALSLGPLELWSDDFEGKGEFSQYRSRLLELIRFISNHKPLMAATKVSERIVVIVKSLPSSSTPAKDLAILESMQLALENVVVAVFDGSNEFGGSTSEVHLALCRIFEGLLQELLTLKWTAPMLVEDPSTNSARHARLQICTSFIRIAKAADKSLLPHMKHSGSMQLLADRALAICKLPQQEKLSGPADPVTHLIPLHSRLI